MASKKVTQLPLRATDPTGGLLYADYAAEANKDQAVNIGGANGVAVLDGTGNVSASQLPPLEHDVGQAANQAAMLALPVSAPAVCIRTDFTPAHVFYLTADPATTLANWVDTGEFGAGAANPTGLVGPAAVNGVAATYMRSDASPAINLAATYSWTGAHTFGLVSTNATPSARVASTNPQFELQNTAAAADAKRWGWSISGLALHHGIKNDAGDVSTSYMTVVRNGAALTSLVFGHDASVPFSWAGANAPWTVSGSTGTPGQVLTSTGNATSPSWQTPGGALQARTGPAAVNLTPSDAEFQLINSTPGTTTVNLPDASNSTPSGKRFTIKNIGTAGVVIDAGNAAIDGGATAGLANQYECKTMIFDGTNYHIIAQIGA